MTTIACRRNAKTWVTLNRRARSRPALTISVFRAFTQAGAVPLDMSISPRMTTAAVRSGERAIFPPRALRFAAWASGPGFVAHVFRHDLPQTCMLFRDTFHRSQNRLRTHCWSSPAPRSAPACRQSRRIQPGRHHVELRHRLADAAQRARSTISIVTKHRAGQAAPPAM